MSIDTNKYRLTERNKYGRIDLIAALIGIVICIVGYMSNSEQFNFAYLIAFTFWVSLALGALFFTMLQHLTTATWSITVRRISESITVTLPWLFILFIPVFLGLDDLYLWTHADAASDPLLLPKLGFLNVTFFTIRTTIYFTIWSALAIMLRRTSLAQDRGDSEKYAAKMRTISAGGMVIYALTVSAAGFDWLMSLDPHWYSTIFGVYYFAGGFVGSLAMITGIALLLRYKGILKNEITPEHYHDLGKLMFGFIIFWAYIAFSQYLLQWYGNIPEETIWYLHRWDGVDGTTEWKSVSLILLFGHFFLPFVILIFRNVKRNFVMMSIMSIWILVIHWIDIYWLVAPTIYHHAPHISWIDIGPTLAIGGIFGWIFWRNLTAEPIVPIGDSRLENSIKFVNR